MSSFPYNGYGGYGYGGQGMMARGGAVESSPATPFEKVSGNLHRHEESVRGAWIGAGSGGAFGGAGGAALGYKLTNNKYGALAGGLFGTVAGVVGGLFAGSDIAKGKAALSDLDDDGKGNGSRRHDFQQDRTYTTA